MTKNHFELHRLMDNLIYKFDKKIRQDNIIGYKRQDANLWITYREKIEWCAYNESNGNIEGIPWDVKYEKQNSIFPPEGIWVSRKNEKSYVYDLKYNVVSS